MSKNIFEETRKSYRENTERLILETELVRKLNGVIKKLNDEVDTLNIKNENLNDAVGMLTKQKEYLQSKLREKEGVMNEKSNVGSTREEIRG
jgi:chaperonin cofactor prefoldin